MGTTSSGNDDASNWSRALKVDAMRVLIGDLIRIGVVMGPDVAERVYLSLADEPRTARGDRIDWAVILEEIARQAPRERYPACDRES